jgi:hypothetical protein
MSTQAATIAVPYPTSRRHVTQARVFLSEWTKLRSLRSTRYALLATAAFTIGFGILASAITASRWSTMTAADKANFNPLSTSLLGVRFGVLAIGRRSTRKSAACSTRCMRGLSSRPTRS